MCPEGAEHVVRIRIGERFDAGAEALVQTMLRRVGRSRHVVIDFHEVRSFDPAALIRLAGFAADVGRTVILHGLCQDHLRLLRYCLGQPGPVQRRRPEQVRGRRADDDEHATPEARTRAGPRA